MMTSEARVSIKQYIQILLITSTMVIAYLNNRKSDDIKYEVLMIKNSIERNTERIQRIDKSVSENKQDDKEVHLLIYSELDKIKDQRMRFLQGNN